MEFPHYAICSIDSLHYIFRYYWLQKILLDLNAVVDSIEFKTSYFHMVHNFICARSDSKSLKNIMKYWGMRQFIDISNQMESTGEVSNVEQKKLYNGLLYKKNSFDVWYFASCLHLIGNVYKLAY